MLAFGTLRTLYRPDCQLFLAELGLRGGAGAYRCDQGAAADIERATAQMERALRRDKLVVTMPNGSYSAGQSRKEAAHGPPDPSEMRQAWAIPALWSSDNYCGRSTDPQTFVRLMR